MSRDEFLADINKRYSDHYKYIGQLKRKAEERQTRRLKMIFIGLAIIIILEPFTC